MIDNINALIIDHEGFRSHAYKCPANKWTIGIGRNIQEGSGPGVTREEAEMMLQNDIARVTEELRDRLPWFDQLDEVRKACLIDMTFNMGIGGMMKFKTTLRHVGEGDYAAAAAAMKQSAWFTQVGRRSQRLCRMMMTGRWPDEMA